MAAIPAIHVDPTLEAVAAAQVDLQPKEPRGYIGGSSIGHPCDRNLWYRFHWVKPSHFDADTLRRFEDGHAGEAVMADRLRLVPGIKLITLDPSTGKQVRFDDVGGHVSGGLDGMILGILQAAGTWHVWEHKQVGEDKFRALELAKQKHGEKGALEAWDEIYYAQGMLYCHWSRYTRHYLTCSTPGGRRIISCRTEANRQVALKLLARGERIVKASSPPARISEDASWYQCKMCDFHDICHQKRIAAVNCRTCIHATPEMTGSARWSCAWHPIEDMPLHGQREGCDQHILIPSLVPIAEAIDGDEGRNSVRYRLPTGEEFENGPPGPTSFTSAEISKNGHAMQTMLGDVAREIRRTFNPDEPYRDLAEEERQRWANRGVAA